ncbi:MAG TPA: hypothetical protein PKO36_13620 [Candidatus Hydrogenedentes bacterium]|nr:hypothetical protein [Candidatus Hydrogenedentota bacterium]HOV74819.1 hypothetical protein [Candidatus Hydrogenedentota bacterium]
MCGLGGMILARKKRSAKVYARLGSIFGRVLVANEERGPHATGCAAMRADGSWSVLKYPIVATRFINTTMFGRFLKDDLDGETAVLMGHTRWASRGNPLDNGNNHPVISGNGDGIITHNGHIRNADSIFRSERLARKHEVDSEVFAAMAARASRSGTWNMAWLKNVFTRLSGSATVVMASRNVPASTLVWKGDRPLFFRYNKTYRVVIYASAYEYLDEATAGGEAGEEWMDLAVAPWTVTEFQFDSVLHVTRDTFYTDAPTPNRQSLLAGRFCG